MEKRPNSGTGTDSDTLLKWISRCRIFSSYRKESKRRFAQNFVRRWVIFQIILSADSTEND